MLGSILNHFCSLNGPQRRSIFFWRRFRRWKDDVAELDRKAKLKKSRTRALLGSLIVRADHDGQAIQRHHEDLRREERGGFSIEHHVKLSLIRNKLDWSLPNIYNYLEYDAMLKRQFDQRYIVERHFLLGPDLAAAHFLVHRGAAVKFVDDPQWYRRDEKHNYSLPGYKVPGMYIEAIDASGTELVFEGFDNMVELKYLRLMRLADCKYIDDWCMSKISQFADSLELLDLTNCPRISAQGLTALAQCKKLKRLRIGGIGGTEANSRMNIAQVSLQLEESIPGLEVTDVDYDGARIDLARDAKLASHSRVFEDAKGTLCAVDENGHEYPIGGKFLDLENPQTDDFDMPYFVSKKRMDVPNLPMKDLITLDRLSRSKVRHLLIGSPSSALHWSHDVEKVLAAETKFKEIDGAEQPHFLLPTPQLRQKLVEQNDKDSLKALEMDVDAELKHAISLADDEHNLQTQTPRLISAEKDSNQRRS